MGVSATNDGSVRGVFNKAIEGNEGKETSVMKKYLALLVAGMLCACCLGLAACGGSSGSSAASLAASGSDSAASESASAASESASAASASAASANASSATSDQVDPGLKEAAEKLVAVADEQAAIAEKAKAAGSYEQFETEWKAAEDKSREATAALKPWVDKFQDGTISDADKAYYMKVVVPAASKSAQAGLDMLDLIEL